jgi:hypothetical protein
MNEEASEAACLAFVFTCSSFIVHPSSLSFSMYSPIYPRKPRPRRNHRHALPTASPTPPPLTLVQCMYDFTGPWMTLAFDRAIDISAIELSGRPATLADVPFMDGLQKKYGKALGYFPTKQFEGYVQSGGVLIAEEGERSEVRDQSRSLLLRPDL